MSEYIEEDPIDMRLWKREGKNARAYIMHRGRFQLSILKLM